ncbi:MAG: heme A synthase, partial [Spirochaetia bacterium]
MRIPSGRKPILGTSDDVVPMVRWLLIVSVMILAIVVIGGITRLTESGVSIVEWKPITG